MIPSLLYAPDLGAPGSALRLSPDESHYLARVCRARAGDQAEATDGRGGVARLRLDRVGLECRAEVISVERRERARRAWMWCGAPERGRADWLIEKLAELGVERFQPLEGAGSAWPAGATRMDRWSRIAIAALRQSRSPFLLEVRPPVSLETALLTVESPANCWLGDPSGGTPGAHPGVVRLEIGAIGPSGGFSSLDRERLSAAGFAPIRLADCRLRTETAALAMAAWWAAR